MKRNYKALFLGLTLAAGSMLCPVKAQSDSVSMDLDKVLEVALSENTDIQVANKTIEIKKYAKKEAITGLFPTVSASVSGSHGLIIPEIEMQSAGVTGVVHIVDANGTEADVPQFGAASYKIPMGKDWSYNWSGAVTLPLVVPQLWKSIQVSQEGVELALEQARASKVSTISSVRKAYYSLLATRESYKVYQNVYKLSAENYELTRNMFKQGLRPEIDTLKAYADLVAIEPNIIMLRNTLPVLEMQLKVLMGVDINEPIRFVGDLKDYEAKLFRDLMILKDNSDLEDNTTLKQLDSQKRQLIMAEKINKLGYLPTLALQFSVGNQFMMGDYMTTGALTLALSWTLFDGGTKYMKSKQNNLTIESLELQQENVRKQLEMAITSSLTSIETAAEQVVADKAAINAAQRSYDIMAKSYELGAATQLEVHASAQSLESAWLQYVQAINDFVTAQATLEETLGRAITE